MQSPALTYLALLFLAGFISCSTFEPDFTSDQFRVGQASRVHVSDILGEPDEIDTVLVPGKHVLIFSYRFTNSRPKPPELFRGVWQVPQKNLAMEFVNDSLHGYIYNSSMGRSSTSFNKELRSKIPIGRANKSTVLDLLGEPAGKIMLPTSLFGHPSLKHLAHVVPRNSSEVWCYYYEYPYFRAGSRCRFEYYKFFALYFNSAGMVVDKFFVESEKNEPRITQIYGN